MKFIIAISLVFFYNISAGQHSVSLGPDLALGSNFRTVGIGPSASFNYKYQISSKHGIVMRLGYSKFPTPTGDLAYTTARLGYSLSLAKNFFFSAEAGYGKGEFISIYKLKTNYWGPSLGVTAAYSIPIDSRQFIKPAFTTNFFRLYPVYNQAWWYVWFNVGVSYGLRIGSR
jgi:hypothetical protein